MSSYERVEVVDTPNYWVYPLSIPNSPYTRVIDCVGQYKKSIIGCEKEYTYKQALSGFSPDDQLGRRWFQMRHEAMKIDKFEVIPLDVLEDIASVWRAQALVWFYDQELPTYLSPGLVPYDSPISNREFSSFAAFFPLDNYKQQVKMMSDKTVVPEWRTKLSVGIAQDLLNEVNLEAVSFFRETNPESFRQIKENYFKGVAIGVQRMNFISSAA